MQEFAFWPFSTVWSVFGLVVIGVTADIARSGEKRKKLECWDAIREIALEAPATVPPELHAPAAAYDLEIREPLEAAETIEVENDIGSLLLRIRPLFARDDMLRREELAAKLSEMIGYPVSDPKARQETDSVIQAAVRRGILQDEGHEVSLVARNIAEYPREVLKDQFLASLNGSNWTERSESIPRFAQWLGFRRTGPNIEDAARSVINSLIRGDRLEKMGSQIRRT